MITITKKQASLTLIVTAFAAVMFAGPIALNSGINSAFVYGEDFFVGHHHHHHFFFHHHGHHFGNGGCGHFGNGGCGHFGEFGHHGERSHIHQSIFQGCNQHQHSTVLTAGAFSPVVNSGNNAAGCSNVNLGGNAAATDQSNHE